VIIDAPDDPNRILEEAEGVQVKAILSTHTHADQLEGLDLLRSKTDAPVWVNADDATVFNYFFAPVNSERPGIRSMMSHSIFGTPGTSGLYIRPVTRLEPPVT